MKISHINLFHFRVPFGRPIKVSGRELHEREGFVIAIHDQDGRVGWGEVAPLPGLDHETQDQCLDGLKKIAEDLSELSLDPKGFSPASPWMGFFDVDRDVSPLVQFGVESALLWLMLGHKKGLPGIEGSEIHIPVNGLFVPGASQRDFDTQITHILAAGFSTLKVKIGRMSPEAEIRQILDLSTCFDHKITLRLDANQSLDLGQYAQYYESLQDLNVEYVEEPLKDGTDFFQAAQIPWPLALDESLGKYAGMESPPQGLGAIIIKPGSFRGVHGMVQAMETFAKQGIGTVLSSSFNTGIGVAMLGALGAMKAPGTAHGLDTLKYLEQDLLAVRPGIQNGKLSIPIDTFFSPRAVSTFLLEEIA